jgi:GTP-binding protein YchF
MSLKIGIVGLPNVGKSTLFNALTRQKVEAANYPFATIEPNVGVVEVPDERLQKLAALSCSRRIISAVAEFVDIAGLVEGASEGAGLGNSFLSHIRETDAIAEVIRVFTDENIVRASPSSDPLSDIKVVEIELILKDLETVEKRLISVEREARGRKKEAEEERNILLEIKSLLEKEILLSRSEFRDNEIVTRLSLLTAKPVLYVFNCSESQLREKWSPSGELKEALARSPWITLSAQLDFELSEFPLDERQSYLSSLGLPETGMARFIRAGYGLLNLITFFTTGEDETRAWTIPKGSLVPRAGRAIHSDFEEKFIRARVIAWDKLLEAGSWEKARELGRIRTEGKEYEVRDGDVVGFVI